MTDFKCEFNIPDINAEINNNKFKEILYCLSLYAHTISSKLSNSLKNSRNIKLKYIFNGEIWGKEIKQWLKSKILKFIFHLNNSKSNSHEFLNFFWWVY